MIETLRSFRIFDFAVIDFAFAILGLALLSPLLTRLFRKVWLEIPIQSWMLFAIPIWVITHALIWTNTPLNEYVFSTDGHLVEKIIVIVLLVLGIAFIRKLK